MPTLEEINNRLKKANRVLSRELDHQTKETDRLQQRVDLLEEQLRTTKGRPLPPTSTQGPIIAHTQGVTRSRGTAATVPEPQAKPSVTPAKLATLEVIRANPGIRQTEMVEKLNITRGLVSVYCIDLVKKGLVEYEQKGNRKFYSAVQAAEC